MEPRCIKRLDPSVVCKIAAGEVVNRPANALKELMENSLDAGATAIQVEVKDGGMKLLQIVDNGCGVRKEDLELLCERYTTSKLGSIDDLRSVNTYGFRGEALSSISLISHVTMMTKTAQERCGYKVSYSEGKLKGKPLPCGANQGTTISVENMFYNVPLRQKALKNFFEEHKRMQDIVARYAIHNASVGFSLKKYGQNHMYINTLNCSTTKDVIGSVFGADIARNLLEKEGSDETLQFKYRILTTSLIYSAKQMTFLLFINHRLVKAEGLQREIGELYGIYLPPRTHPFIYISLEMPPGNVDVNVHPRKENVFYLYEEPINKKILTAIQQMILGKDAYKTYVQETLSFSQGELPKHTPEITNSENKCPVSDESNARNEQSVSSKRPAEKVPSDIVILQNERSAVNGKEKGNKTMTQTKLAEKVVKKKAKQIPKQSEASTLTTFENTASSVGIGAVTVLNQDSGLEMAVDEIVKDLGATMSNGVSVMPASVPKHHEQKQSSLLFPPNLGALKKNIIDSCDRHLRGILETSTFITSLDYEQMLIAKENNVYECDLMHFCKEYFYQVMLNELGKLNIMNLSEMVPLQLLLQHAPSNLSCSTEAAFQRLMENAKILNDYFSIKIDDNGNLLSLPWLLEGYYPSKQHLPEFILRLACYVSWDKDHHYVDEICLEIASYYSKFPSNENSFCSLSDWNHLVKFTLFPAIQKHLWPSKQLFLKSICEVHV